jgi:lysozyme family protein
MINRVNSSCNVKRSFNDIQIANTQEKVEFPRSFEKIYAATLALEGGYSNDPSDPGSATMFGLSARWNPDLADKIRSGTLTRDEAYAKAYQSYYLPLYHLSELPIGLAFIIFDAKFHGMIETIRELQLITNDISGSQLAADGVYGRNTFNALVQLSPEQVIELIDKSKYRTRSTANSAAKRVIAYQRAHDLPEYDYSHGFFNRANSRMSVATKLQLA